MGCVSEKLSNKQRRRVPEKKSQQTADNLDKKQISLDDLDAHIRKRKQSQNRHNTFTDNKQIKKIDATVDDSPNYLIKPVKVPKMRGKSKTLCPNLIRIDMQSIKEQENEVEADQDSINNSQQIHEDTKTNDFPKTVYTPSKAKHTKRQ